MSVILIKEHEENIYNVTSKPIPVVKKSPRYRSIFKDLIKPTELYLKTCVKKHATMGLAEECLPNPQQFLRKKSGRPCYPMCRTHPHVATTIPLKPPDHPSMDDVKKFDELHKKKQEERDNRNVVAVNAEKIAKTKTKEPIPTQVLTRMGDKRLLSHGLEPRFIHRKNYGRVPKYLQRYINQRQKEHQMRKDIKAVEKHACRYVTRQQREELLRGLKLNWEELQKKYQGLPILTDTIPKQLRKAKMEATLKQLESDIVLLERHPYIYVYDNDEV